MCLVLHGAKIPSLRVAVQFLLFQSLEKSINLFCFTRHPVSHCNRNVANCIIPRKATTVCFIRVESDVYLWLLTSGVALMSYYILCSNNPDFSSPVPGSLPPSPADSGVSDVDSSSSGHTSTDELRLRLQPQNYGQFKF